MTGSASARGGLGWVILVISLAVPGVLFYNWWSHLKMEREKAVAVKGRGRAPDGGVFQSSPNAKLVNPMTSLISTGTGSAAPLAVQDAAIKPQAPASIPSMGRASLKRDPMLSPFDRLRIVEEEQAKIRAASALAAMQAAQNKLGKKRTRLSADPQTLVELQGIVSNPENGYKAMVNNEVVDVGQFVGTTKIKVVKITDLNVTFDYQGKRFSKSVNRD